MKLSFTVSVSFVVNIQNYLMCTLQINTVIFYTSTHLEYIKIYIHAYFGKKKLG